jgi:hypothetical protein
MSRNPPVFRKIGAPLDVSDDDLNALGDKLGVPTMVKPETPPAPAGAVSHENPVHAPPSAGTAAVSPFPASPMSLPPKIGIRTLPARRPTEKVTVELPDYLAAALRREGVERRTTARTLVIMGLKALGFDVEDQDLIPDGRRARPKRGSSG